MADLEPFVGTRYAPHIPLAQVIAPPYDVVTPEQRRVLGARHSANAVRVELPEPDRGQDRYRSAAALLRSWQVRGTLVDDPGPALYVYRMTVPDGQASTGVIGALEVDAPDLLPHEETLPKPASDRLDLLRATQANLSPIWGLSLAPGLTPLLHTSGRADAEATDDDGVDHQLWVITDPTSISAIREHVAGAPTIVADGHHRLETARRYHEEADATGRRLGSGLHETGVVHGLDGGGSGAVLALVTELTPSELTVGAIHRAITGLAPGTDLVGAFRRWFTMVRAGGSDARTLRAVAGPEGMALVTPGSTWLLTPRAEAVEQAGNNLDSAAVNLALQSLSAHEVTYCHSRQEAVDLIERDQADAVVLLRAVPMDVIAEWARAGRRMPPKSTYFWPKPRTGMVFRLLERDERDSSSQEGDLPT